MVPDGHVITMRNLSFQTARWGVALQSWEGFCATPTDSLFTVPAGLKFDMNQFKDQMCSLNVTALIMEESPQYFGVDKLLAMVSGVDCSVIFCSWHTYLHLCSIQ